MRLWPTRRQWKSWSLPSKLTAIGTLVGILSLAFFVFDGATGFDKSGTAESTMISSLDKMRIGVSTTYVQSLFGAPNRDMGSPSGNREMLYVFKPCYLQVVANRDGEVVFFAVTLRDRSFKYAIPYIPRRLLLGKATYSDFGDARETYFNVSSKVAEYAEKHYYGNPAYYLDFWAGFTNAGISLSDGQHELDDSTICTVRGEELAAARKSLRPNTIGISRFVDDDIWEFGIGPSLLNTRTLE